VVVFPTPPFWLAIAMILARDYPLKSMSYKHLAVLPSIITGAMKREEKNCFT
jgi:hypothetical protein